MRQSSLTLLLLAFATQFANVQADDRLEALEERAFREAALIAAPSIVRIETVGGLDVVNGLLTPSGPTTGIVVGADGWIMTSSFNFASQPASILVTLPDGQHFPADVIANDLASRLTLLKIDADDLQPITPAAVEDVQVGEWAIALGRTYDQPFPNISVGIVSAVGRIWGKAVQTDAKISPTNYGGPLVNVRGEAIGVLVPLDPQKSDETAGVEWYDSGIGFAIPLEIITHVLARMQSGEDLYPGRLGVTFDEQGFTAGRPLLDRVRPTSPAYQAGLRPGDVITSINGIETPRAPNVRHVLGSKYAGETVTVTYLRDDAEQSVEVTLVDKLEAYAAPMLGILPSREATKDETSAGAGVRLVLPDTPAAEAGLQRRDRIISVNGEAISDVAALRLAIGHLQPQDDVELVILREDTEQIVSASLAAMTAEVPDELPSAATLTSDDARGEEVRTGRWVDVLGEDEARPYWAYVPESYDPDQPCGLVVWLHPAGDTMESDVQKLWQPSCDRRGLILVGPKTSQPNGWTPAEVDFVTDLVEDIREHYAIDPQRIVVHGYGDAAPLTAFAAFREREVFRGASLAGAPLRVPPVEAQPESPLQFHFTVGADDPAHENTEESVGVLRERQIPTVLSTVPNLGHAYPPAEAIEAIARWVDALDRI